MSRDEWSGGPEEPGPESQENAQPEIEFAAAVPVEHEVHADGKERVLFFAVGTSSEAIEILGEKIAEAEGMELSGIREIPQPSEASDSPEPSEDAGSKKSYGFLNWNAAWRPWEKQSPSEEPQHSGMLRPPKNPHLN
jgi:hypothetical protein